MKAVHSSLRALGYVEGSDLIVFYRYAEGDPERLAALASSPRARKTRICYSR